MSHVVNAGEVPFNDLGCLFAAFERIGGEIIEGKETFTWYGHWADDSPIPEDLFSPEETERLRKASREERVAAMEAALSRCDHAVRFKGARYEVGIVRREDGRYDVRWDWWGSGGLLAHMGDQKASKLRQAYGIEAMKRTAKMHRQRVVKEVVLADGSVKLLTEAF